jgi:hypothetical protein
MIIFAISCEHKVVSIKFAKTDTVSIIWTITVLRVSRVHLIRFPLITKQFENSKPQWAGNRRSLHLPGGLTHYNIISIFTFALSL